MSEVNKMNSAEELYAFCKNELFAEVMEKITNEDLVEDITSEIFMNVMCHEKWFFDIDAERQNGYVHNMCQKVCRYHLMFFERKNYEFKEEVYGENKFSEDTYDFMDKDIVDKWIESLPENEKRTVEKRYIENKSIETIAMEEGISKNAVSKRLSRARFRLKNTVMRNLHDSI